MFRWRKPWLACSRFCKRGELARSWEIFVTLRRILICVPVIVFLKNQRDMKSCFRSSFLPCFKRISTWFLPFLGMGALMLSCQPEEDGPAERALIVYMAADNNLSPYAQRNIDGLMKGMASAPENTRTIVYLDKMQGDDALPYLFEVTAKGTKRLYTWEEDHNSASPEVFREVLDKAMELCPANAYGLSLWSHGTGWLPGEALRYLAKSASKEASFPPTKLSLSIGEGSGSAANAGLSGFGDDEPSIYYCGQDDGVPGGGYLEMDEIAAALPDGMFDYILFDACFMASAEALYPLRDKVDYVVASPMEVIADGFPYATITRYLLQPVPDLQKVCEGYFAYYAEHADSRYHSATISLIDMAQLGALATLTGELMKEALAQDPEALLRQTAESRLQVFDRYRRHFLYDMDNVMENLQEDGLVSEADLSDWRSQLARTVLFERHTASFLGWAINRCCGLSVYVPSEGSPYNPFYEELDWAKDLGL